VELSSDVTLAPPEERGAKPPPDERRKARDASRMVLVPKGVFLAGEEEGEDVETPRSEVRLPAFWIDMHPVTNRRYAAFVVDTGRTPPEHWKGPIPPDGLLDHPVVQVTWQDAADYASWCGKRLPTPHEWQKAARGTDGRTWPWGSEEEVERCNCRETGFLRTTPVGQFRTGVSPFGLVDAAGNVAEWVDGSYLGRRGPTRAVCGGSYRDPLARSRCAARRGYPDGGRAPFVGFRCARDPR
jgi:formylglycine-generating enzyme required for sulfatase activity